MQAVSLVEWPCPVWFLSGFGKVKQVEDLLLRYVS